MLQQKINKLNHWFINKVEIQEHRNVAYDHATCFIGDLYFLKFSLVASRTYMSTTYK